MTEPRDHRDKIVPPVVAVLELGQIARDMLRRDFSVGPDERGLDVAKRGVDPLESRVRHGFALATGDAVSMRTALVYHPTPASQAVGIDIRLGRKPLLGGLLDLDVGEPLDLVQRNSLRPTVPVSLHRSDEGGFAFGAATAFTWLSRSLAAQIGVIHLHPTAQRLGPIALHHHLHEFVFDRPGGVVGHAKSSHQFHGRDTVLGLGEVVDGAKPDGQRQLGGVEDRACGDRTLGATISTLNQRTTVQPVPGLMSAGRAAETVGPALLLKQGSTLLLGAISRLKYRFAQALLELNWIARHSDDRHVIEYTELL